MTLPVEIQQMPVADRMLLVEALWDSILAEPESLDLTDAQRAELDRRIDDYHASPEEGESWESVRARLRPADG